jgi:Zn-dependent metalloprotease
MAGHVCFIVPPYLLSDIAEGQDPEASRLATETLASIEHIHHTRKGFFEAKLAHAHHGGLRTQDIVPDYVLEDIAGAEGVDEATQQNALDTLAANRHFREQRTAGVKDAAAAVTPSAPAAGFARSVYDMETREKKDKGADITYTLLPGKLARSEGQAVASDKAVNEVYDNCLKVLQFFQKIFNYNSLNGQNMPVVSSVHYKKDYQNASWIGVDTGVNPNVTYNQMVYGDGGGDLVNFTNCIDVMGHEMTVSTIPEAKPLIIGRDADRADPTSMLSRNSTVVYCTKTSRVL